MNINRNNYEEYFILYMDNELNSEERRSVETFVQLHPDLQEELELLMQTKLVPDENIVFTHKEDLTFSSSITLLNYEEWLVAYIDNELTPGQKINVEAFLTANPSIQQEFFLLQQTKLPLEIIEFPYKDSLYRKEEKVRRIAWKRIAAAAVLLLTAGSVALLVTNSNGTTDPEKGNVAANPAATIKENVGQQSATINNSGQLVENVTKENTQQTEATTQPVLVKQETKENIRKEIKQNNQLPVAEKDQPAMVTNKSNNLPAPDFNPNVIATNQNNKIQQPELIANNYDKPLKQNDNKSTVTPPANDTYNNTNDPIAAKQNNDVIYASDNTGKKGKLRGFFRKVTRTFEKRTNIDPTDDDDRLLIGGLAIHLK